MSTAPISTDLVAGPRDSAARLFSRFLRFGFLAWGGPVAQIDMLRQELVTEERWVTPGAFRRILAVYQVLPGPEAHELCVHFGMIARGRWGGVLAGLGFMLPGLALMVLLSWFYARAGLKGPLSQAIFLGVQPAVVALIIRASHRIGRQCLTDCTLGAIAAIAGLAEILGTPFWLTLASGGLGYALAAMRRRWQLTVLIFVFIAGTVGLSPVIAGRKPLLPQGDARMTETFRPAAASPPPTWTLFGSGLRAGLLTFGGAYTAIPFLERDAVEKGRWMTEREFLDGVALTGIIPAPLIIFSTFVGFIAGGFSGALVMTLGIFLPAFVFPLTLHRHLETLIRHATLRHFLEGVTAGVVGIIVVTALEFGLTAITDLRSAALGIAALIALHAWHAKLVVPLVMASAGAAGAILYP